MCGLFGVCGTLKNDDWKVLADMAVVSAWRGLDSTGVVGRSHKDDKGEVNLFKTTGHALDFLEFPKATRILKDSDQLVIGHTRSRTVGEVNKRNAQPFDFENVVGTHNGTLDWDIKNKLEGPNVNLRTDSEALYHRLNLDGIAATVGMISHSNVGSNAMALVWYDKQTHSLNFYRNTHRPLHYCYDKGRERIFWLSEVGAMYAVMNRNHVDFDKVHLLPEELHFRLPLPEKKGDRFPKPETRSLKQPRPFANQTGRNERPAIGRTFAPKMEENSVKGVTTHLLNNAATTTTSATNSNVQSMSAWRATNYRQEVVKPWDPKLFKMDRMIVRSDANGGNYYLSCATFREYNQEKFDKMTAVGCSCCGQVPYWGEPIKFLKQDDYLCAGCMVDARKAEEDGDDKATALELLKEFAA